MASKLVQIIFSLVDNLSINAEKIAKSIKKISDTSNEAGKEIKKSEKAIADYEGQMQKATVVLGGLTYVMGSIIKSSITSASKYEDQRLALTAMTKSAVRADMIMRDVIKTAQKTPFEATQLLDYASQLYATGTAQKDLIPTMVMLGDIASGVGKDKLPNIVYAFRQIQAAGRLMAQDLLQLEASSVPVLQELSIMTGKTTAELRKMMRDGQVTSDMVNEAFKNMTKEGGRFYNMMAQANLTTSGRISNLMDVIDQLKISIMTNLLGGIKVVTNALISIANVIYGLPSGVKTAIGYFLAFSATALSVGSVVIAFSTILGGLRMALMLLGASTGIGLLAAGISLAVLYSRQLLTILFNLTRPINEFNIRFLNFIKDLKNVFTELFKLIDELALRMNKISGKVGIKLFDVNENKAMSTDAIDNQIKRIQDKIKKQDEWMAQQRIQEINNEKEMSKAKIAIQEEEERARKAREENNAILALQLKEKESQEEEKDRQKKFEKLNEDATLRLEMARQEMVEKEIIRGSNDIKEMTAYDKIKEYMGGVLARRREIDAVTLEEKIAHEQKLLEIDNLTAQQKQQIESNVGTMKAQKIKAEKDAEEQGAKNIVDIAEKVNDGQISIYEGMAESMFGIKKEQIIADIKLQGAQLIQTGQAMLTASLFTNPMGWAHLAGGAALLAGGIAAANAIKLKLADGGIVMPRNGGVPAIVGEAGQPEAVIPLNSPTAQRMMGGEGSSGGKLELHIDGGAFCTGFWKISKEMSRNGRLPLNGTIDLS